MPFFDKIEHMVEEYSRRAIAEGRAAESHFLALIKEMLMTTANDIQSKLNSLGEKLSKVEADVGDLVKRSGGTTQGGGVVSGVTQEQLDAMGSGVDNLSTRLDNLHQTVLNGPAPSTGLTAPPETSPPATPPPSSSVPNPSIAPTETAPASTPGVAQ